MGDFKVDISELNELEIPKYGPIFMCVGELFGDYVGVYFKLIIDNEEYILQRRDDLFVLYQVHESNEVSYEMFTIDEEYNITSAGFDDFEMHTVSGDRVIQKRNSNNIESLVFIKRKDGEDVDGYDGTVGYVQYNQEHDVRLMLIFQQMYNYQEKVYGYHVGKSPFQILIEKGVGAKQRGSIIPVRTERYMRGDFDERDHPYLYNIAVIKDYGLVEFMEKGAYALQKDNQIIRYYKMIHQTKDGYAVTSFPFGRQYKYEDFYELFAKYGFNSKVPEYLIEIHNDDNRDLNRYEAVASFMKEIEMTPPDEVVTLNLKFEGDESNGKNN